MKLILLFVVLHVEAELLSPIDRSFHKIWTFKKNQRVYGDTPLTGNYNDLSYIVCENVNRSRTEVNCNITVESRIFSDTRQSKTCNLRLLSGDEYIINENTISIKSLENGKIIVSRKDVFLSEVKWSHGHIEWPYVLKVRIVDMATCKSTEPDHVLNITNVIHELFIIPYKDTFDVIVRNDSPCNGTYCVLTYDIAGNQVGNAVPFVPNDKEETMYSTVLPVDYRSSTKGFFVVGDNFIDNVFNFFSVKLNGKKEVNIKQDNQNLQYHFSHSNSHELFSVCWTNSELEKIQCLQMDENFKNKVNVTLNRPYDLPKLTYNLKDGGFLLWTMESKLDSMKYGFSRIFKIYPTGEYKEIIEFSELFCKFHEFMNAPSTVYENEKELCFSTYCRNGSAVNDAVKIGLSVKCINKSTVSNK